MNTIIPNKRAIIVPVDFSNTSQNALMHAADHADVFDNDIVMLHVLEGNYISALFSSNSKNELMGLDSTFKIQVTISGEHIRQEGMNGVF